MYIPSIFHFSIFTNPYSTSVYPMKSPGNPQEIPMKISMRHTKQWFGRPRPVPAPQKTDGTCCEKRSTASTGKKRGPQHGMHGSCLTDGLVMIGYDWVCLKKKGYSINLAPEPPICHGDPNVGCPDHMVFLLPDGVPRLKTAGRSMSCCLDDPTAYILWFS